MALVVTNFVNVEQGASQRKGFILFELFLSNGSDDENFSVMREARYLRQPLYRL
jgi:hypothetical protein